jgi:hypothetical protein
MALILSPEPIPVEVTAALPAAAVLEAVDAAVDIVELMCLPVPSKMADLSA